MGTFRSTSTHVYFWGGYFSQWATSKFTGYLPIIVSINLETYLAKGKLLEFSCTEQYMMAAKASIFGDNQILDEIMNHSDPSIIKGLGRKVKNFDQDIWAKHARNIVYLGNFYKFTQDADAKAYLDESEQRYIVEGSPYDKIWGVGLAWNDPAIENQTNWNGTNWLGEVLMVVRDDLNTFGPDEDPWGLLRSW